MSLIFEKKEILEYLKEKPGSIRRLYVVREKRNLFRNIIEEAKRQGISLRLIKEEEAFLRTKNRKVQIFLEADNFSYLSGEEFLEILKGVERPLLALFDGIYDPQNFGNILRTAASFTLEAIIIPRDRSCGVTETVKRVSKGGFEFVRVVRIVNVSRYIEELKSLGIFILGLDERGERDLSEFDLKGPICFVFGREEGLRRLTRKSCDAIARIETQKHFPSLNLATSFAITLYEAKRQRLHL